MRKRNVGVVLCAVGGFLAIGWISHWQPGEIVAAGIIAIAFAFAIVREPISFSILPRGLIPTGLLYGLLPFLICLYLTPQVDKDDIVWPLTVFAFISARALFATLTFPKWALSEIDIERPNQNGDGKVTLKANCSDATRTTWFFAMQCCLLALLTLFIQDVNGVQKAPLTAIPQKAAFLVGMCWELFEDTKTKRYIAPTFYWHVLLKPIEGLFFRRAKA